MKKSSLKKILPSIFVLAKVFHNAAGREEVEGWEEIPEEFATGDKKKKCEKKSIKTYTI